MKNFPQQETIPTIPKMVIIRKNLNQIWRGRRKLVTNKLNQWQFHSMKAIYFLLKNHRNERF